MAAISAALSFRPSKANTPPPPMELSIWKPNADDVLGITFELPADEHHKGVVVGTIHPGYLMAKAKKLKVRPLATFCLRRPLTVSPPSATCSALHYTPRGQPCVFRRATWCT